MGVPPQALTVTQWPLFLATVAGGILFGLLGIQRARDGDDAPPSRGETLLLLFRSIWPILLVLGLSIVLGLDLILSLLVTIVALLAVHRPGPSRLVALARRMPLGTVPIIFGAMIFRRVLESSQAIEAVSQALAGLGIPLPLIVFAVPLIAGLLTGLAVAAFAIGFPIVFPLCGPDLVGSGYGLLAYAGGYVGIMITPMHLCLSLTRVYFNAEWGGIYRRLLPAGLLVVLTAVLVFVLK